MAPNWARSSARQDGTPLHGANLLPRRVPELRDAVLAYTDAMTQVGHALMEGIALSLGLEASYFEDRYTGKPLTLFRIFNYSGRQWSRHRIVQPDSFPRHNRATRGVVLGSTRSRRAVSLAEASAWLHGHECK